MDASMIRGLISMGTEIRGEELGHIHEIARSRSYKDLPDPPAHIASKVILPQSGRDDTMSWLLGPLPPPPAAVLSTPNYCTSTSGLTSQITKVYLASLSYGTTPSLSSQQPHDNQPDPSLSQHVILFTSLCGFPLPLTYTISRLK